MKAFLLDPALALTDEGGPITEIDYSGDWREINTLIGSRCFTAVYLPNGDTMYVDDEGLLGGPTHFIHCSFGPILAGRGLILGADDEGDSIAPQHTTREWIEENFFFSDTLLCVDYAGSLVGLFPRP